MSGKEKISKGQIEVLMLMANGWTACWTGGLGHGAVIQQGKIGWGGASRSLNTNTFHSLAKKKLIQRYSGGIGSTHYKISQKGIEALGVSPSQEAGKP